MRPCSHDSDNCRGHDFTFHFIFPGLSLLVYNPASFGSKPILLFDQMQNILLPSLLVKSDYVEYLLPFLINVKPTISKSILKCDPIKLIPKLCKMVWNLVFNLRKKKTSIAETCTLPDEFTMESIHNVSLSVIETQPDSGSPVIGSVIAQADQAIPVLDHFQVANCASPIDQQACGLTSLLFLSQLLLNARFKLNVQLLSVNR